MPSLDVRNSATGGLQTASGGRDGASLLNQQYGGSYSEAVLRGRVFSCANQTGVTSPAGPSGALPILALYNPAGSGVNVHVWYVGCTLNVAFTAASAIAVGLHQTTAAGKAVTAVGTVSGNTRNMLASPSLAAGQAQVLLGCTAATPIFLSLLGVALTGAITTVPYLQSIGRWYDGALVLQEDTAISIQTGVVSGNLGVWGEFVWEERDKKQS